MVDFNKKLAEYQEIKRKEKAGLDCIIAGSRGLAGLGDLDLVTLAAKRSGFNIRQVLSGTANGIDNAGEKWAAANGKPVLQYPAEWDKYGKGAGYQRNLMMARVAEALVAVWDGKSKGTSHIIETMTKYHKPVYVLQVTRFWVSGGTPNGCFESMVVADLEGRLLWTPDSLSQYLGRDIYRLVDDTRCDLEKA